LHPGTGLRVSAVALRPRGMLGMHAPGCRKPRERETGRPVRRRCAEIVVCGLRTFIAGHFTT
ncbi:Hypothetical predicted protein, partial [Marmota monax]